MVTWRYQRLDKHRMVPPFIIIIIMKKFFILMCLVAVSNISSAQSKLKEADFIGNVRILNADSTTVNLERINVQLKTKATGSKIWWGIGSSKAFVEVPGKNANTKLSCGKEIKFIVRASDNNLDPMSIVSIFQYTLKGKNRRAEFGKVNNLFGNSTSGLKRLDFEGEKYGEHSYIITLTNKEPGEYGIIVNNPNLQRDDSNLVVYSFALE